MTVTFPFTGEIVWRPTAEQMAGTHLTAFMQRHGVELLDELQQRSTGDVAWFTEAVIDYLGVEFTQPYTQVVDLSRGIQWPEWCVGGRMNIVTSAVDKWARNPATAGRAAVMYESEEGDTVTWTYAELAAQVNRAANALRALGVGKGDAVGIHMPMTPEIVAALLAIAKIGAVIVPLFSGYGADAIAMRLNDAGAKALFTADGFPRRGGVVKLKPTADAALAQVPTVTTVIVLRRMGVETDMVAGRDVWWDAVVPSQPVVCEPADTAAEDVVMVIYTSGTTGRPKGAVHTHCGFPIKAAQDMAFGMDVHPGEVIYWMTDMGWMMGPWLVFGALLLGAACFMYDGAPDYPAPDRLWALTARHGITQLGVSPTLIRALVPHGIEIVRQHDLSKLRAFASTGEPWNPEPWLWLFNEVGQGRVPIINYSGGTEIAGGILCGNFHQPLKPAAFSGPCPGMAADVVDEDGNSVRGAVGELVIRAPWIGMTRGFWKDDARYIETYWSRFENVWVHGDFAAIDADGLWYILGRSDDTIKVAGKRLGPAEVESILVADEAVVEAAAIGVPDEIKGSALVCFAVLAQGVTPSAALEERLVGRVAAAMGKPMAPKAVKFVTDLPKTRNAKVMRRLIRAAYLGLPVGDTSSLVNPEAVEAVRAASASADDRS